MKKVSKKKFTETLKRLFLLFSLLTFLEEAPIYASCPNESVASQVDLHATLIGVNPTPGNGERPRSPIQPPTVYIDGYTLDLSCVDFETNLQLVGADGEVLYSILVPQCTAAISLPSYLSGNYELRLIWGNWCFYGDISL